MKLWIDDVKIILVENFPCNPIYELHARENYYIENNECVNKIKAYTGLTRDKYTKEYQQKNKAKTQEHTKVYQHKNKEKIQKNS